jgi:uncharacterized protein YukE
MPNEYYAKYQHLSHQELYDMLMAGQPPQIEGTATDWAKLQGRADDLTRALTTDLNRLASNWSSASGQEYQRRLGLIGDYSTQLGEDFAVIREQLSTVADELKQAQTKGKADNPADVHPHHTLTDGLKGALAGSPLGLPGMMVTGTIGALHGHDADEAEKEKARQRMIQIVADLATSYGTISTSHWDTAPAQPPADLPGGGTSGVGSAGLGSSGSGTRARTVHGLGTTSTTGQHRAPDPGGASTVPPPGQTGSGDGTLTSIEPSPVSGSGLASAGAALLGAGLVNATALDMARGRAGGQLPGQGTTGGVSGALNQASEGVIGAENRPSQPAGRAAAGLSRTGIDGRGATGAGGQGHEEEPDEHHTWLTEDDMVWGGDEPAAPAVLGGPEPDNSGEPETTGSAG